jgi:RNA polymerase sigma factor (TIGR02999 family)
MSERVPDVGAHPTQDSRGAWWPVVSDCLHQLAEQALRGERRGHTLQPTALVHEAWLRLNSGEPAQYNDQTHFQAVAARALREVLVDHARRRAAAKRGGAWTRVTLSQAVSEAPDDGVDVLALEEALVRLAADDARAARVVELRFFGGLSIPEVAGALQVSPRTIDSDWQFARAWLMRELASPTGPEPPSPPGTSPRSSS